MAAAGVASVLATTVALGLVPTEALGASVAVPTSTPDTTIPDPDGVLGEVTGTLDDQVAALAGAADEVTGNGDTGTTTTTTTQPEEEPDGEQAPAGEQQDEEPKQQPPPAEVSEEAGMGEEQAPPSVVAELDRIRSLSSDAAPVPVVIDFSTMIPRPLIDFVDVPAGPRSTSDLMDVLQQAGATQQDVARILAPFPVAGLARYSNDWGAPRHSPYPHPHEGTDVFAGRGTPVVSSFGGVVTRIGRNSGAGGNSVHVAQPDGTYAYYAHLDDFGPAAVEGALVAPGAVLGTVGTSGNAAGTPPHLHYEIHPGGGEAVPPLPYLDSWLAAATERARAFAQATGAGAPPPVAGEFPSVQGGFVPVTPFQPASVTDESPVPGLVMLVLMGGGIVVIRRRHRYFRPLRIAWARLGARFPRRRVVVAGRLITFPFDTARARRTGDDDRVVDVLEPFLSRERVGARR